MFGLFSSSSHCFRQCKLFDHYAIESDLYNMDASILETLEGLTDNIAEANHTLTEISENVHIMMDIAQRDVSVFNQLEWVLELHEESRNITGEFLIEI